MPTTRTRRRKSKLINYLPKAASAVSFQNPTFSPGREKQRLYSSSGFSGPLSIVPDEARRRPRGRGHEEEEDTQEPNSPKVSCIGQIKLHKCKNKNKNKKHNHEKAKREEDHDHIRKKEEEVKAKAKAKAKKQDSKIHKIFGFGFGSRKGNDKKKILHGESGESAHSEPAPAIGHMKRFSSGRQSLANFDWTAQIAPVNDLDDREFHSDDEFGRYSDNEEEEDEVIIPFSAPMVMGGGGSSEPRKEVNLWQRRNTTSPPPLNLKPIKVRSD